MADVSDAVDYAAAVLNGSVITCKHTKDSCSRFTADMAQGDDWPFYFDVAEAQAILDFYATFIRHVKGELRGKNVDLEPWQAFILVNLFGWRRKSDNFRRYRTAYIEVARKNAKSTLSSGMGLYLTGFDGEGGADVYSAATKKDQARIVFEDAQQMVRSDPSLSKMFGVHRNNLHVTSSYSKFEPLSADANSLDGLNVYAAIVDELHAHKTREVWDVLETATGARQQSLLVAITTAGTNKEGICYELRDYCIKILSGQIVDDTMFGIVYTLDDDDDWHDEALWIKANPNLNVSVKLDDMRRLAQKASEVPTARNNFLTKRLNIWTTTATAWMNMDKWDRAPSLPDEEHLQPLPCWIGIDLANKLDVAAVVLLFEDGDDYHLLCKFYMPQDNVAAKSRTVGTLYRVWAESGYMTLTDGNIIDHDVIEADLRNMLADYDVREVAYDPWGATQLAIGLTSEGAPMVEVAQTVKNFSESMKTVEAMVMAGQLHHGDNPALNWMAGNVTAKIDQNENVFPRKEHPDNKIDGMVALFMAVSRMTANMTAGPSVYETEELLVL